MTATALLLAAPPSADACMWVLTVSIGKTEACSTIPDSEPAIMWSVSWLPGAPSSAILLVVGLRTPFGEVSSRRLRVCILWQKGLSYAGRDGRRSTTQNFAIVR